MKITIALTKHETEHLLPTHTFEDCCSEVESIMTKVHNAVKSKNYRELNKEIKRTAKGKIKSNRANLR